MNQEKLGLSQESKNVEIVSIENENSEFDLIKESWRISAEERFGIKDFNIEIFKRTILKSEFVGQAFAEGKDWNYV